MNIAPESLREKYGDETVLGVDQSIVTDRFSCGFTSCRQAPKLPKSSLLSLLELHMQPRLRCEAELDPTFKQLIPYVILLHSDTGSIYTTTRLGGDSRLIGQVSIGLGGHMEEGESFITCLLRELKEEVGLVVGDINALMFSGYLYSDATDVDSVHLGLVYLLSTSRNDLTCLETDKLVGAWRTIEELSNIRSSGILESWSEQIFDAMRAEVSQNER